MSLLVPASALVFDQIPWTLTCNAQQAKSCVHVQCITAADTQVAYIHTHLQTDIQAPWLLQTSHQMHMGMQSSVQNGSLTGIRAEGKGAEGKGQTSGLPV